MSRSGKVLVTGYAQLPRGTCLAEKVGTLGVVLEIDPSTDTITDAEFMLQTELAKRFCRDLMVGYSLSKGIEPLLREIAQVLLLPSQQAVMMAIRSATQRYWERTGRRAQVEIADAG